MRWIVNFDHNLLDGLVLAAVVAAYCPYLVRMFFNIVEVLCAVINVSVFVQALFCFAMLRRAVRAGTGVGLWWELQLGARGETWH